MNAKRAHFILGALWLAPWCVFAQQPPMPPEPQEVMPPPAESAPIAVEDRKLDQFADAFVVVQEIQRTALQRLEQETDVQKAAQVKAQAENDAVKAVEKVGLPLAEFNQIAQAMMSDVGLREKVASRVAQRRPSAPAS
jgi:hypothetical protein